MANSIEHLMTQETYQKAIRFAGEKHQNQLLPGSTANYLVHLSNVAMEVLLAHSHSDNFDLNLAIQIAILHDTLEDTDTSYQELADNFGGQVAEGVLALTKNNKLLTKKEQMLDSLNRIDLLSNEIGIVKLADRITNLQEPPKHWNAEKKNKYLEESKIILHNLEKKNKYLADRLKNKIENYTNWI